MLVLGWLCPPFLSKFQLFHTASSSPSWNPNLAIWEGESGQIISLASFNVPSSLHTSPCGMVGSCRYGFILSFALEVSPDVFLLDSGVLVKPVIGPLAAQHLHSTWRNSPSGMSYTAVFFPLSVRLKDVSDTFLLDPAVLPSDLEKPVKGWLFASRWMWVPLSCCRSFSNIVVG